MPDYDTLPGRLYRALRQDVPGVPGVNGPWHMRTQGTLWLANGGAGGTSTTDDSAYTPGGSSLTPIGAYVGGRQVGSGNVGVPAMSGSAVLLVDVIKQPAGGGAGFASVAVYGSPGMPVYNVGTVHMSNPQVSVHLGNIPTVNLGQAITATVNLSNIPTVNLGSGITATVNLSNIPTVNLGSAPTVNIGNTPLVDTRRGMAATTWPISFGGSGYFAVAAPSANPAVQVKLHSVVLVNTGTCDISFQSPSGTFLTGSMRILPGAGFAPAAQMNHPILIGAANGTLFIQAAGTQNIGGWAAGWIE